MKKRVLYVDDNPNNRLLVKRILHKEGYEVLEAEDGESGWTTVVGEHPDFIFMDLLMPGVDGFDLVRKIKSAPELSHIPVVMLTAYGSPETEKIAKEAGSDGFLYKPATTTAIRTVLHQFLSAA